MSNIVMPTSLNGTRHRTLAESRDRAATTGSGSGEILQLTPAEEVAPPPPAHQAAPAPAKPRRSVRQKLGVALRRTVGLALVAVALWWLVLPLAFPVTSDAIVNARTVQVRAPIEGTASDLTFDVRDTVASGQSMARLDNHQLDKSGLTGLTTRRAELISRRERLGKEMAECVKAAATYQVDADRYRDAVVKNLESAELECKSREKAAAIEFEAATRRVQRLEGLGVRTVSEAEMDSEREKESVTRSRVALEQASLTKCRGELAAARRGLFLQKDAPHFQQKADEMTVRIPQIKAELKELIDLLAGTEAEIKREEARTDRLTQATVVSPVGGTVWTRQGNRGQGVKQNEVLFEIADGGSVFVEAVVHQRHLGAVAEGTPATINVTRGPCLAGRVKAVRSGRPNDNEPTFAFGVADPDPKRLRVVVELAPGVADPIHLIGRHVRVLIADGEADACQRTVVWLFSNLRL